MRYKPTDTAQHFVNLFLIVEFNKVIIGSAMIGYDGHRGSLYYLAVDPKHQRKGVGEMFMKEIEKRLIEVGCCLLYTSDAADE